LKPICPIQIAELFDRHAGALELYASTWTRNAADCVQEAFIAIAKEPDAPESPAAWLYKVVRHIALNSLRSTTRRRRYESSPNVHPSTNPSDPALTLEQLDRDEFLKTQLQQLPQRDRELIVARIWGELTWQEIGELTESSKSTAERKYNAALQQFKSLLESTCTTDLL
jgi:RNA polymerase sigma-70 factor (ECF subfamily)